jgi:hypothetical protein
LKGQAAFQQQVEAVGGTYTCQQVADLLDIKPDTVRKRRSKGHLIAILKGDHYVFPAFQFDQTGVVEHLPELLDILQADSPIDAVQFFLIPESDLGDSPINALMAGHFDSFGHWLGQKVGGHKAALTIHRYLPFFMDIERQWRTIPDYHVLLNHFGTQHLRRVLLPMRWMEEITPRCARCRGKRGGFR